ncbi:MAG TPA: 1,4-beta-xylanase [Dehalococcoidia bacterium]|jgi:hypothetical protein|nr:1,4-beta-xylanase [Dehalococcoidia bacterium]
MAQWTSEEATDWYSQQPWLVGCNFLPSSAINQLEMFQAETYDPETITRELLWARELGFNSLRVYLHDLLWDEGVEEFCQRLDHFLNICSGYSIRPILVLFDDCHRPDPIRGRQPLPIVGVHNSGWKQSPGRELVTAVSDGRVRDTDLNRLELFVKGVLGNFSGDDRVLMWDIYNEPGQSGMKQKSLELLHLTWEWAHEIRPSQPLTACLDGAVGEEVIALNAQLSDIISFHSYEGDRIEEIILSHMSYDRPLFCTEYMARELGSTFQKSLPIFKKYNVSCYNWGLVAGKSQTHFGWSTIASLETFREEGQFLGSTDLIPEPETWFHDIFRRDGSPFDLAEVKFIRDVIGVDTIFDLKEQD